MAWLRLHGHALGTALRRVGAQPVAFLFSVAVLAMAISLPVIAAIALRSIGAATQGLDTDPHVNVYLDVGASADDAGRVEAALRAHPGARQVRFVPRDQALAELESTTHLAEILAALERNPLPHAFTVKLRSAEPATVARARADFAALPGVEQVQADFEWSRRLARWVRFGERLVLGGWLLLGSAVAFIVGHLIRLQVVTRKEEIEVSQLIGATAADVRRPFLYYGAGQGLAAGVLAVAIAVGAGTWANYELSALTNAFNSDLQVLLLPASELAAVVAATAALGLVGAWVAVGRELRRFSAGAEGNLLPL